MLGHPHNGFNSKFNAKKCVAICKVFNLISRPWQSSILIWTLSSVIWEVSSLTWKWYMSSFTERSLHLINPCALLGLDGGLHRCPRWLWTNPSPRTYCAPVRTSDTVLLPTVRSYLPSLGRLHCRTARCWTWTCSVRRRWRTRRRLCRPTAPPAPDGIRQNRGWIVTRTLCTSLLRQLSGPTAVCLTALGRYHDCFACSSLYLFF